MTETFDPVFHIGYQKTATTFLQKRVFSDSDVFVQPWGDRSLEPIAQFVLAHPEKFSPRALRATLTAATGDRPGRTVIVSHEDLSGYPVRGRYYADRVAARIQATCPEARILIGIREQVSMMESLYYQYIKQGGTRHLRDLLTANADRSGFRPTIWAEHFEYDLMLDLFARHLPPENVLVLPIELLERDSQAYFKRLYDFLGMDRDMAPDLPPANRKRSPSAMRFERFLNRVFPAPEQRAPVFRDNPLGYRLKLRLVTAANKAANKLSAGSRGSDAGSDLREEAAACLGDRFAASNSRLAARTGLPLAELGYRCRGDA